MASELEVDTFGGLRIHIRGRAVTPLDAQSAEALLVYLARQPHPVARDVLAEMLWPERAIDTARANLRSALHRLRRAFAPHVTATRSALGLDGVRTDAGAFEVALRDGRLAEAVALYRGDFLAGFYLDGSPGFESWVATEADRLRGLAVAAHQGLLEAELAHDRPDAALARARSLLELEPLHEPAHRAVIRLLALAGRRPEALAQFASYRRRLLAEYGLEPDEATARLAAAISNADAERPVDAPPHRAADGPTTAVPSAMAAMPLPAVGGALIGRRAEVAKALQRLADADCRWLSIVGAGGAGKTRLAIEVAARAATRFDRGAAFVALAGVPQPDLVLPVIAEVLRLPVRPGADLGAQFAAFLRDKEILLVLDNLEHVIDAMGAVAQVLRDAPSVKVLATSRTRLHLSEEWLLPLDGLPAGDDAVALFAHHARRADPGFEVGAHRAAIEHICARVDCLPLAVELAATWVNALAPERIAAALEHDATLQQAPRLDLPERHRSMSQVFEASWRLLPTELADVFVRLAPFRGGFAAPEAERVAGATLSALLALVDRSLLRSVGDGRFELHELLRRYTDERLDQVDAGAETRRRHALAYADVADHAVDGMYGSDVEGGRSLFRTERDNLRAALEWSLATPGERALAVRLLDGMAFGWRLSGALDEARAWLDRGLGLAGRTAGERAALGYHLGQLAWMRGEADEADRMLKGALGLWEEAGGDPGNGPALARMSLGMNSYMTGDLASSRAWLDAALASLDPGAHGRDTWWRAAAHGWKGKVAVAAGEVAEARAAFDTCLRLYAELDNPWGSGLFVGSTADLHLELGDRLGARRLAERSVVLLERVGFSHALAPVCAQLGRIARGDGDEVDAATWFRRGIDLYRELGDVASAERLSDEMTRPRDRSGGIRGP